MAGFFSSPALLTRASTSVLLEGLMEEWGFVDDCDLQNWKGGVVCMTCQHLTNRSKLWAPT